MPRSHHSSPDKSVVIRWSSFTANVATLSVHEIKVAMSADVDILITSRGWSNTALANYSVTSAFLAGSRITGFSTIGLSCVHHTGDSTILLDFTPIVRKNTMGWSGSPTPHPFRQTAREEFGVGGYLDYYHASKKLYIYKHPRINNSRIRTQAQRHSSQRH
ncbi:hypothetical protein TNCV_1733551 [Trichonephila clavipes]|nr:hypothetical protein TNCV_1733551 [Trichonephila clavipes]